MKRLLDVRILRWQFKLLFVIGAWVITALIVRILAAVGVSTWALIPVEFLLNFVPFIYGTRVFRVAGEPVMPARPWWKMTGRAKLSRRLGTLFVAVSVLEFLDIVVILTGFPGRSFHGISTSSIPGLISTLIMSALLGVLYLKSGARLTRIERNPA